MSDHGTSTSKMLYFRERDTRRMYGQLFTRLATKARLLRPSCCRGRLAWHRIISGIFYTYDVTRQTVRDDARAETRLNNQQLPDNL
jgi:hypothetical protein